MEAAGLGTSSAQGQPKGLFGAGNVEIGGVAEQVDVEMVCLTRGGQRADEPGEPSHESIGVLIVRGHDQRRAGDDRCVRVECPACSVGSGRLQREGVTA